MRVAILERMWGGGEAVRLHYGLGSTVAIYGTSLELTGVCKGILASHMTAGSIIQLFRGSLHHKICRQNVAQRLKRTSHLADMAWVLKKTISDYGDVEARPTNVIASFSSIEKGTKFAMIITHCIEHTQEGKLWDLCSGVHRAAAGSVPLGSAFKQCLLPG